MANKRTDRTDVGFATVQVSTLGKLNAERAESQLIRAVCLSCFCLFLRVSSAQNAQLSYRVALQPSFFFLVQYHASGPGRIIINQHLLSFSARPLSHIHQSASSAAALLILPSATSIIQICNTKALRFQGTEHGASRASNQDRQAAGQHHTRYFVVSF